MIYFIGCGSPYTGKTFQVQDLHRWMVLIRGHKDEESRLVDLYFIL